MTYFTVILLHFVWHSMLLTGIMWNNFECIVVCRANTKKRLNLVLLFIFLNHWLRWKKQSIFKSLLIEKRKISHFTLFLHWYFTQYSECVFRNLCDRQFNSLRETVTKTDLVVTVPNILGVPWDSRNVNIKLKSFCKENDIIK